MKQTEENSRQYDDEVTLVDLATIFITRRRIFLSVFSGIVILAVLYAMFLMGETREYSSLIQLGEKYQQDKREPLVSAATISATIENRWYPELQGTLAETEGSAPSFRVEVANPASTMLIKLASQASPASSQQVARVHQYLIDRVIEQQKNELQRERQALQQRLDSTVKYLQSLSTKEAAGEAAAQAIRAKLDLEAQLNTLKPAEVLVVSRESRELKGTSKPLIIILAVFLAVMAGTVATFFAEFGSRVRRSLAENESS